MLTIKDLKHMIAEAEAEGVLSEASEVRVCTRTTLTDDTSLELSLEPQVAWILPDAQVPPQDRRYGDGVLVLAHEQVMRCTPPDTLKQLDWR